MIDLNTLPNRKENETTTLCVRRHWIVPFRIFMTLVIGFAVPVGAYLLIANLLPQITNQPMITQLLALIACFYVAAVWIFVFQDFVNFYLDMWIVTNERVINIEQNGLFQRTSSELHLTSIVDVTSDVKGFFATIFNYGDIIVQTAGEQEHFHFQQIAHPEEVRQTILKLVDEDRERHPAAPLA